LDPITPHWLEVKVHHLLLNLEEILYLSSLRGSCKAVPALFVKEDAQAEAWRWSECLDT
jgi:hypothetical protein